MAQKGLNIDKYRLNLDALKEMKSDIQASVEVKKAAKIQLVNISKKYEGNDKFTLENINLTIEPGNFAVLLGPSGSGKTTLLRMIAGLNSITSGDLLFDNKRYNNLSPSERNIAMVFQSYALYPHMNVFNNMSFSLKLAKVRKDIIYRRVNDAASLLKIKEHLYNKPRDLSGGQRQRVAIGRAIVRKPSVFLMDEPLSNLDAKLRESTRRELVEIHRGLNTTTIYVTHDQLEAMTMGDQIVVLNENKIQQNGTAKELYFQPANLFVARFIGSPTMNIIEGEIIDNRFQTKAIAIDFNIDHLINHKIAKLQAYVGFRSEQLIIHDQPKGKQYIEARIHTIEAIGKEQSIILAAQNVVLIATVSNIIEYKLDQIVWVDFDFKRAHLFDFKTEKRIN